MQWCGQELECRKDKEQEDDDGSSSGEYYSSSSELNDDKRDHADVPRKDEKKDDHRAVDHRAAPKYGTVHPQKMSGSEGG